MARQFPLQEGIEDRRRRPHPGLELRGAAVLQAEQLAAEGCAFEGKGGVGRDEGGLRFFEYLRVGFPVAVATTFVGTVWLVLTR